MGNFVGVRARAGICIFSLAMTSLHPIHQPGVGLF